MLQRRPTATLTPNVFYYYSWTLQIYQTLGVVVDLNVLRLYPVELEGARIEDGNAEIYLRFDVQEVKVLVDKKGELKQGTYDDLMKTSYGMCAAAVHIVLFTRMH